MLHHNKAFNQQRLRGSDLQLLYLQAAKDRVDQSCNRWQILGERARSVMNIDPRNVACPFLGEQCTLPADRRLD